MFSATRRRDLLGPSRLDVITAAFQNCHCYVFGTVGKDSVCPSCRTLDRKTAIQGRVGVGSSQATPAVGTEARSRSCEGLAGTPRGARVFAWSDVQWLPIRRSEPGPGLATGRAPYSRPESTTRNLCQGQCGCRVAQGYRNYRSFRRANHCNSSDSSVVREMEQFRSYQ